MNILFIHPTFPGQFIHLAAYLANDPKNNVVFLAEKNALGAMLKGVRLGLYKRPDEKEIEKAKNTRFLSTAAESVLKGEQILISLDYLRKKENYIPDIIIGHTGWGSMLFVKDYYPSVKTLGLFEWYFHAELNGKLFCSEKEATISQRVTFRTKNAHHLLSLEACDAGYTPTRWQYDQFPKEYQYKLSQIHDGIDTEFCSPLDIRPGLLLETASTRLNLPEGTEIVTYVSRGFEEMRGFPQFMDAIRILLKERPLCHVILAGADSICYGDKLQNGQTYKTIEDQKGGYDKNRIHFVGHLHRDNYQKLLRASSCHVYLTLPYVLSWSMLEAMSFGLPLVASDTIPCKEVVTDNVNGLLADFYSPTQIAQKICELLDDRQKAKKLGHVAREIILDRFEVSKCVRQQETLINKLMQN